MNNLRSSATAAGLAAILGLTLSCTEEPPPSAGNDGDAGQTVHQQPPDTRVWIPPEGVSVPNGRPYRVSTENENEPGVVHGSKNISLIAHLEDPGGTRELRLVSSSNEVPQVIAPAGWNILPVAAVSSSGEVLVCWNHLTGLESPEGGLPHPSAGLELRCRYGDQSQLGEPFTVGHDRFPAWLIDLGVSGEVFTIAYLRNASGWIVGPAESGDGFFYRTFDGTTLSEATELSGR